MFLARIDGTVTSTVKHETLAGLRLLIDGSASGDPLVLVDTMGARQGSTVMVTTENEPLRKAVGNTTPVRLLVAGIVDEVYRAPARAGESPAPPTAPLAGAKERT
jgi:ethanolamine utilization protein EutN